MDFAGYYWVFYGLFVAGVALILTNRQPVLDEKIQKQLIDEATQESPIVGEKTQKFVWSQPLQWGYLLCLIALFGVLSEKLNFSTVLLIIVVLCGIGFSIDRYIAQPKRQTGEIAHHFLFQTRDFFPVIFFVFFIRAFLIEPFQIPSSSMRPGLAVGDFILVNKFVYGLRSPIDNRVFFDMGKVDRGDVFVFNYPKDPKKTYIKRAVGVPGDVVEYTNKTLKINGVEIEKVAVGDYRYQQDQRFKFETTQELRMELFSEKLNGHSYKIANLVGMDKVNYDERAWNPRNLEYPTQPEGCEYFGGDKGFRCTVPEGHYFAMGDNRDQSGDSRYWGFVPENMVVGKAFFIWLNLGDWKRIGTIIK